jgi:drug/metabolite transporter (DMT)-like permease
MTSSPGLHLKTYVLMLVMVIFGPLGDVLLGKGMKEVGTVSAWVPAQLFQLFVRAFLNPMVWLGIVSLLTFFIAYTLVLSWADFSFVQPASAFSYGIVALLGHYLLGETIFPLRWAGIIAICLGVFFVGRTPPRTTASSQSTAGQPARLEVSP